MDMNQIREGKVTATDVSNALTRVQTLLTEYEKHIRDCLPPAEAEKPKLEHGDYGTATRNGNPLTWVWVEGTCFPFHTSYHETSAINYYDEGELDNISCKGNIDADLKAIAEPLTDMTFYIGSVKCAVFNGKLHMGDFRDGYPVAMEIDRLPKLILNLQRLQYTERQKNDNQD